MPIATSDPIADMLTRIRNAVAVGKNEIRLPHSMIKESLARILKDRGFIEDLKITDEAAGKALTVIIGENGGSATITEIRRLSKPGRRAYTSAAKIPVVKRGRGLVIISTSRGIMTGDDARQHGIGGELICEVY